MTGVSPFIDPWGNKPRIFPPVAFDTNSFISPTTFSLFFRKSSCESGAFYNDTEALLWPDSVPSLTC
uniref:Uncharacterized protein n=1 Tax=Romanomermis culicivorax TaxID=13658 RepID=A0A915J2S8_ROMCU